jgi:hypothetical protein
MDRIGPHSPGRTLLPSYMPPYAPGAFHWARALKKKATPLGEQALLSDVNCVPV